MAVGGKSGVITSGWRCQESVGCIGDNWRIAVKMGHIITSSPVPNSDIHFAGQLGPPANSVWYTIVSCLLPSPGVSVLVSSGSKFAGTDGDIDWQCM